MEMGVSCENAWWMFPLVSMTDCPYSNRRQLLWWSANRADTGNVSQVFFCFFFLLAQSLHICLTVCRKFIIFFSVYIFPLASIPCFLIIPLYFWSSSPALHPWVQQSAHFHSERRLNNCTDPLFEVVKIQNFLGVKSSSSKLPFLRGHLPSVIFDYFVDEQRHELFTCCPVPPHTSARGGGERVYATTLDTSVLIIITIQWWTDNGRMRVNMWRLNRVSRGQTEDKKQETPMTVVFFWSMNRVWDKRTVADGRPVWWRQTVPLEARSDDWHNHMGRDPSYPPWQRK